MMLFAKVHQIKKKDKKMKKTSLIALLVLFVASIACMADTRAVSLTATNGQAIQLSAAIPASGTLDKIEVVQTSGYTSTVTVATYAGTTAVDTFVSLTALVGNKVIRPRIIGTTTAGVNLAAATQAGSDATTNTVGTALVAAYERPIVGGNLKVAVTPSGASVSGAGTNTVDVILYFNPLQK